MTARQYLAMVVVGAAIGGVLWALDAPLVLRYAVVLSVFAAFALKSRHDRQKGE